jgi:outer membrane murein-binding lipoprotein Lpp
MRIMQTTVMDYWDNRRPSLGQALRTARHRLAYVMAIAIAPLLLGGCAELTEYRTDITQLRSDLQANTQLLTQLSARVDTLERYQADTASTSRQMRQELSQAIEALRKKALVKANRQIPRQSGKSQTKDTDMLERQDRPLGSETQRASSQGGKHLGLGMTQEDVRRTFGEPVSIEHAGAYIFWQYSQMTNQKYVIFEKASGLVSGWRGL